MIPHMQNSPLKIFMNESIWSRGGCCVPCPPATRGRNVAEKIHKFLLKRLTPVIIVITTMPTHVAWPLLTI